MENQPSEQDLKNIAKQLSCPEGEHGVKTGQMMNVSNIGMTHTAIEALALQPYDLVLEIGPGNGKHVEDLIGKKEYLGYIGIDISETMIEEAKKINDDFIKKGNVHFHLTDGINLPFLTEQFDKIFTVNTIYFWKDPEKYLQEIKRILNSSGLFVLCFAEKTFMEKLPFTKFGFKLYDLEEVKTLLISAGFEIKNSTKKTEQINSNAGFMVERDYFVVSASA